MTTSAKSVHLRNYDSFLAGVQARTTQVGVIGLGYVGLPLALLYTQQDFPVTGFDVDEQKITILNSGSSYIHRIPASEIRRACQNGFRATIDYAFLSEMDAVMICVPTPLDEYHTPDLSFIVKTAEAIAPHLRPGQLIILESTTYPGTTEEVLLPILERSGLKAARNNFHHENEFFLAFSPEREDPGNDAISRSDVPKVVGGIDSQATSMAAALYNSVFNKIVCVSSTAVAEMTKLLENIYRCVNIALVNELKMLCQRMGIDIWEVIDAAKTKPFGFQAFYPGPGLGGHCIPIDPFYLSWKAKEYNFHTRFIELAGQVNTAMPYHIVSSITSALNRQRKSLNGASVLVLGVAYKKDIDDLRESPALTIIELLQQHGAIVAYNDPYFPAIPSGRKHSVNLTCTPLEQAGDFDCVLIVADHSCYDYKNLVTKAKLVVDTRNATRGMHDPKIVLA